MGKIIDGRNYKVGDKVKGSKLTIVEYMYTDPNWVTMIKCKCDCGKYTIVTHVNLFSGNTRSCGCLLNKDKIKHGYGTTKLYRRWHRMLLSHTDVCERWKNFNNYKEDVEKILIPNIEKRQKLVRIDNSKPWCKDNIRNSVRI